ncbi:hypothetical protein [Sphingobacterium hotanense]|uniref:ArnR1-like winged helix-turn-helix domain-containing protein n=1 Tax=Sphingobacterium hotanense TaxID=649196 RepID=A0ABT7NQ41_9SPHI|nr:hypothetical protein [Sphingobacterium hotanense]MDM1049362.1 hypothetical protein [Sphingobacterium hotanense]
MDLPYQEKAQLVLKSFVDHEFNPLGPYSPQSFHSNIKMRDKVGRQIASLLLELKSYGLLESDSNVTLENRLFYITGKGISILRKWWD